MSRPLIEACVTLGFDRVYRTSIVLVYVSVASAIGVAAIVVALPYDTSWLMVAITPLTFLAILSACLFMPSNRRHASEDSYRGVAGVFRSDEFEPSHHHASSSRDESPQGARSAGDFWSGTLRMGTTDWRGPTKTLPVRFLLSDDPVRVTLIEDESRSACDRVVDIRVVECDRAAGMLYLRLSVMRRGHIRPVMYEVGSVISGGTIVPDDDTSSVVFDARQHRDSNTPSDVGRCCDDDDIRDRESATAALTMTSYPL